MRVALTLLILTAILSLYNCRSTGTNEVKDDPTPGLDTYPELPNIAAHLPNQRINILSYDVAVKIATFPPTDIPMQATITLQLNQASEFVDLHFERGSMAVENVTYNRTAATFEIKDGQQGEYGISGDVLRIQLGGLESPGTELEFTIGYKVLSASLTHDRGLHFVADYYGTPVLTARNWPYYIRHWLPSNDHPADTATFRLTVDVPDGQVVAGNGSLAAGDFATGSGLVGELRRFVWDQPTPIPTYGVNFTVGDLEVMTDEICYSGSNLDEQRIDCDEAEVKIPFVYYLVKDHPSKDRFVALAEKGKDALVFYHKMLGIYNYDKLGLVTAPHPFNMESVSMIVMVSPQATVHEVAHHWWGNTVYIEHWGDFWISEGFTTYFTGLYDEHFSGRNTACRSTRGVLANPPATDPMTIFDNTAYCKGAAALMALRSEVATLLPDGNSEELEQAVFYGSMRSVFQKFRFQRLGSIELSEYLREQLQGILAANQVEVSQGDIDRVMESWRQTWLSPEPE